MKREDEGFKPWRSWGRVIALAGVAALLSSCRVFGGGGCQAPGVYAEAKNLPPLTIPPGLEAPNTSEALRIPELKEPAPPPRGRDEPCLDAPPKYSTPKKVEPQA